MQMRSGPFSCTRRDLNSAPPLLESLEQTEAEYHRTENLKRGEIQPCPHVYPTFDNNDGHFYRLILKTARY